jgi:hypothetical protein
MAINPELVERAIAEISKRRANYEYFFDRLSSPEWIEPLKRRGFFNNPPVPETDDGGVQTPSWPPSRFLARMASRAPQQVLEVMLEVRTSNERVHEDFAEAAASMPGPLARQWAEQELDWLRERGQLHSFAFPRNLVDVIETLGSEGEIDVAVALAEELFRPLPATSETVAGSTLDLATPRFWQWSYNELIRRVVQSLLQAAPEPTVELVVRLLKQVISLGTSEGRDLSEDYSQLWRPRLADEEKDDRGIQQSLASVLRDAAVTVRQQSLVTDPRLVDLLNRGRTRIFHRVVAFALARPPLTDSSVMTHVLINRSSFFDAEPSPEYRELLQTAFGNLDALSQSTIFGWIAEGPDLDEYRGYRLRADGKVPSEAELERYAGLWRVRRLALLHNYLPEDWRQRYEDLVQRFGEAEFVTSFEVSTWRGPESPVTLEELRSRSDEELLSLLESYEGQTSWFGPSREGLARTLSELADENAERISRLAPRLASLPPVHVQWALIGLDKAIRSGKQILWPSLIELLEQVVQVQEDDAQSEVDADNYGRWRWVRQQVAGVLESGFRSTASPMPFELRESVWQVLQPLTDDPDPSSEYGARYEGSNMDPATLALNSTRGRAMHAVVSYALWVHRAMEDVHRKSDAPPSFEVMPEVRVVLDRHIDPEYDSSVAVRSVYGQRFPWLALLDERWAASASSLIFPEDRALSLLRDAAWYSYVIFCQPYDHVFRLLRSQYSTAVDRLMHDSPGWRWLSGSEAPDHGLAGHLLSFYWRGLIELGDTDELLERFFAHAAPDTRRFAIQLLGRALCESERLDNRVRERLERLWEWRIWDAERGRREDQLTEIAAFSSWAEADALNPEWRLTQLERILQLGATLDHESSALGALEKLAHNYPLRSARALRLYLDREKEGWTIEAGRREIENILQTCLASENPDVLATVEDLIHWLGSLGYGGFRTLLESNRSS